LSTGHLAARAAAKSYIQCAIITSIKVSRDTSAPALKYFKSVLGYIRYDAYHQSIVLTMWTPAVNIDMMYKTDVNPCGK